MTNGIFLKRAEEKKKKLSHLVRVVDEVGDVGVPGGGAVGVAAAAGLRRCGRRRRRDAGRLLALDLVQKTAGSKKKKGIHTSV